MFNAKWLELQLFAGEGAGGDGGGEAATGEGQAADPGQRLLELGVPADKIRNRAKKGAPAPAAQAPAAKQEQEDPKQAAAAQEEKPTEEPKEKPTKPTWDELMQDPEYNARMQATIQGRLRSAKAAEEAMGKLTPALEVLARKYGQDPSKIDYEALGNAINNDKAHYEELALESGDPVEEVMTEDQKTRNEARQERQRQMDMQEQKLHNRFQDITRQGQELKKIYKDFDLNREMQNPAFARLMAPDMPFTVEQAYHAIHHRELQAAAMEVATRKAAEQISSSIQSGSRRPSEAGTTGQAPSVTTFDYRNASKEQRAALKQRILQAAAEGRKLYPGQT